MSTKGCVKVVYYLLFMLLHQNVASGCTFRKLVAISSKETKDVMDYFSHEFGQLIPTDRQFQELQPLNGSAPRENLMNQTHCGMKYMIKAISLLRQLHSNFFSEKEDLEKNLTVLAKGVNRSCNYLSLTLGGRCSTMCEPHLPQYPFESKRWCLSILQRFHEFLGSVRKLPCSFKGEGNLTSPAISTTVPKMSDFQVFRT